MPKEYINPNSPFPSLEHGFSQIVCATGGKIVYISGQTAWDAHKQIIGGRDLAQQARQALRNVLSAWVRVEPAAAADYVASLPSGKTQDEAVTAIANQFAATDAQGAIDWAQKLPSGPARQNALTNILSQWAEADPRAAADFALHASDKDGRRN